jgi:hypothetical protein
MNTAQVTDCKCLSNINSNSSANNSEKKTCENSSDRENILDNLSKEKQQENNIPAHQVTSDIVGSNIQSLQATNDSGCSSPHGNKSITCGIPTEKNVSASIQNNICKEVRTTESFSSNVNEFYSKRCEQTGEEIEDEPPPDKVYAMFWRVMGWFDKTLDRMRDIFTDFRELSERIIPNPTTNSNTPLEVHSPDQRSMSSHASPYTQQTRKRRHSERSDDYKHSVSSSKVRKRQQSDVKNSKHTKKEKLMQTVNNKKSKRLKNKTHERSRVDTTEDDDKIRCPHEGQQIHYSDAVHDSHASPSYRHMLFAVFLKYARGTRQQILDWVYQTFAAHLNQDVVPGRKVAKWQKVMGNILRRDPAFREESGVWRLADPLKVRMYCQNRNFDFNSVNADS